MSEFTVHIGPKIARQPGSTPQVLSAIVPDPPREIRALDSGTILKGVVQGRDINGLTIIATDKGSIKAPVNPAPQAGTIVTLEVRIAGDRLQVLILSAEAAAASGQRAPETLGRIEHSAAAQTSAAQASSHRAGGGSTPAAAASVGNAGAPASAAAIVAQSGISIEAVVVKIDPEALKQFLANAGNAALDAAMAIGKRTGEGHATAGAPPSHAITAQAPPRSPPPLGNLLGLELRARIEALFQAEDPAIAGGKSPAAHPVLQQRISRTDARPGAMTANGLMTFLAAQQGGGHAENVAASIGANAAALAIGSVWAELPNGAEINVRLSLQSFAEAARAAMAQDGARLGGRIIGHTPSGATIIATPFGAIILKRDLVLPIGSEVILTLEAGHVPAAAPISPTTTGATAQQILLQASRGWLSFAEAIAALRLQAASGQFPDPTQRLPQPGSRLAADIARAMSAIRRGDIEALIGPAIRQARASDGGKVDAIARSRQELAQLAHFAKDDSASEWKCYFLPMWDENAVRQMNLYYRRDRAGGDKQGKSESSGARFVVDVDFTRLGAFQFDGLVKGRRFDLMVRSRFPLASDMRRDIAALFQEALDLGHYKGEVGFQTVRDFPVAPLDDIARRATAVSA